MEIKAFSHDIGPIVDVKEIVGEKVLAKDGTVVGSVESVFVHPQTLVVKGVRVKKGLLGKNIDVGSAYVKKMNDRGVMLSITPVNELKGKKVFDASGKDVGKIKEIEQFGSTNQLRTLLIRRGVGKDDLVVESRYIKEIGKNVILSIQI